MSVHTDPFPPAPTKKLCSGLPLRNTLTLVTGKELIVLYCKAVSSICAWTRGSSHSPARLNCPVSETLSTPLLREKPTTLSVEACSVLVKSRPPPPAAEIVSCLIENNFV